MESLVEICRRKYLKIETAQNVQQFFLKFSMLIYVNWVQLHRKTIKKNFYHMLKASFFWKIRKSGVFDFFQKMLSKNDFFDLFRIYRIETKKMKHKGQITF